MVRTGRMFPSHKALAGYHVEDPSQVSHPAAGVNYPKWTRDGIKKAHRKNVEIQAKLKAGIVDRDTLAYMGGRQKSYLAVTKRSKPVTKVKLSFLEEESRGEEKK